MDLIKLTKLSCSDISKLHLEAAKYFLNSQIITALELTEESCEWHKKTFTTGCQNIDEFLKGGIKSNSLTEVSGESASGKTQLCFQLSITVQLSQQWGGLDGGAVYISTESLVPSNRLVEMAGKLKERFCDLKKHNFTDNIYIEHCADFDSLKFCLDRKIPSLMNIKNIKLLAIDSVAAVLRGEQLDNKASIFARSKKIFSLIHSLQTLLSHHNLAVILVNQVTDSFNQNTSNIGGGSLNKKSPALGMAWANMMHTRIHLLRTSQSVSISQKGKSNDKVENVKNSMANVREMKILSSPYLANDVSCRFIVDEDGVKGIS